MFSSFPAKGGPAGGSARGLLDTSGIVHNRSGAYTADDVGVVGLFPDFEMGCSLLWSSVVLFRVFSLVLWRAPEHL